MNIELYDWKNIWFHYILIYQFSLHCECEKVIIEENIEKRNIEICDIWTTKYLAQLCLNSQISKHTETKIVTHGVTITRTVSEWSREK